MKKFRTALLLLVLAVVGSIGVFSTPQPAKEDFVARAQAATGSIYINLDGQRTFICSGTSIGSNSEAGLFLTARHCTIDSDYSFLPGLQVSFADNEGGPFYDATPCAISVDEDLAVLCIRNGINLPWVKLGDESNLKPADSIFNISYPLDAGKVQFWGAFIAPRFPHFPRGLERNYQMWINSMPMDLTIAHGSSGSGVFDLKTKTLIGVAVGTFQEGRFNIAMPVSRVWYLLEHRSENTPEKFREKHPITPSNPFDEQ